MCMTTGKKNSSLQKNDFAQGPIWKCIIIQAVPLTIAQLVNLLYNVVDRIYLGHLGDGNSMALTGVGLTFPVVTLIMAFTALLGMGGVPLFSMERGGGDEEKAGKIMGNSFALLLVASVVLTICGYVFKEPLFYAWEPRILLCRELPVQCRWHAILLCRFTAEIFMSEL